MYFRKIMGFKSYCCFGVICKVLQYKCKEKICGTERKFCCTFQIVTTSSYNFDAINISWKTELLLLSGIKYSEFAYSIELMMRICVGFTLLDKVVYWAPNVICCCHKGNFFVKCSQQVGMMSTCCNEGPFQN